MRTVTQALGKGIDPTSDLAGCHGVGFWLQFPDDSPETPTFEFGHGGAGGSAHSAWPEFGVGFSYCMNQMRGDDIDPRTHALATALYDVLTR
jgi:CubicO group peptidase (beta-lactamase class C family)